MATEKKSEIVVKALAVRYEEGSNEPVFHETLVSIKGTVRKMLGDKVDVEKNITWICDLDGVKVSEAMEHFGQALRIKMAVIRDRDDFAEIADKLNGSTVHYNDINDWTSTGGGDRKRLPAHGQWLLGVTKNGKPLYTREQVKELLADPIKEAKIIALYKKSQEVSVDI